jgi:hypothetical protein
MTQEKSQKNNIKLSSDSWAETLKKIQGMQKKPSKFDIGKLTIDALRKATNGSE